MEFEISNRDQALFLASGRDLEAQLLAIKGALRRNQEADEAVSESIRQLDNHISDYSGEDELYEMHLQDERVDALHNSAFQDAAHSMAAVGMLAPFVESLFVAIFAGLHKRGGKCGATVTDERSEAAETEFWDPHFVLGRGGRRVDLVAGIKQLSASVGLSSYLPAGYEQSLTALFAYRNKMFHHGFEWPLDERLKFEERIRTEGWPTIWFSKSTSGDHPWIFYMSTPFIDQCLAMIDAVLEGVGKYLGQQRPVPPAEGWPDC